MSTRSSWFFTSALLLLACGEDPATAVDGAGDGMETAYDPAMGDQPVVVDDGGVVRDSGSTVPDAGAPPVDAGDAGLIEGVLPPANNAPDAGHDDSDGGVGKPSFMEACQQTCAIQSECFGVTAPECAANCTADAQALAARRCEAEGAAEMSCLGSLGCEELNAYVREGRREHPTCGAQAGEYFARCTVGEGQVPTGCQKMCERLSSCELLDGSRSACEENCVLHATAAEWSVSTECSAAFVAAAECVGEASCAEVTALHDYGTVPSACASLDAARDRVCY